MKRLDVIPFLDELELLQLRLEHLAPHVDEFWIMQAAETFAGEPREVVDLQSFFPAFSDRIRLLVAPRKNTSNPHERLWFQRDHCKAQVEAADDSVCLYMDLDEFPDPRIFGFYQPAMGIFSVVMRSFLFQLNAEALWKPPWAYPKIIPGHCLRLHGSFLRNSLCDPQGQLLPGCPAFLDCGWHFSWTGDWESILRKARSSAHALEAEGKEMIEVLEKGGSLEMRDFLKGRRLASAPVDHTFPEVIRKHITSLTQRGFIR